MRIVTDYHCIKLDPEKLEKLKQIPYFTNFSEVVSSKHLGKSSGRENDDNSMSVEHIPFSFRIMSAFLDDKPIVCTSLVEYRIIRNSCCSLGLDPKSFKYKATTNIIVEDDVVTIEYLTDNIIIPVTAKDNKITYFVMSGNDVDKINKYLGVKMFLHITFIIINGSVNISYSIKGSIGTKNESLTSFSKIIFDSYKLVDPCKLTK